MTINYHLLKSTKRGIIINKESLFSDIPELTLAFHLDGIDKSTYLCIVKNENNTEHRQYLSNGKIRIEKVTQLFPSKTLNITLVESKNNVAVATYDCEPLSFTNSGDMLKSVWEVYPQLKEFPDRVKQIEIEQNALINRVDNDEARYNEMNSKINQLTKIITDTLNESAKLNETVTRIETEGDVL